MIRLNHCNRVLLRAVLLGLIGAFIYAYSRLCKLCKEPSELLRVIFRTRSYCPIRSNRCDFVQDRSIVRDPTRIYLN